MKVDGYCEINCTVGEYTLYLQPLVSHVNVPALLGTDELYQVRLMLDAGNQSTKIGRVATQKDKISRLN